MKFHQYHISVPLEYFDKMIEALQFYSEGNKDKGKKSKKILEEIHLSMKETLDIYETK